MIPIIGWAAAGLVGVALGLTLFNLLTWPRPRSTATFAGRVSVLVPARNEEGSIGACVDAVLGSSHPVHEVLVLDDGSTDATRAILEDRARGDARLRILSGAALPPGWVGKPHACHQLGEAATGDLLVFVDADVTLDLQGLARVVGVLQGLRADVVTAVPGQVTGGLVEHLVLPLLHLTYTSWLPLVLVHATHDPRLLAANGQILAIRREAYAAIGGFEAVRGDLVDDMALCRRAKVARRRVVFADGTHIARCRMYTSARGVWEGFSKNLFSGLGGSPVALLAVVAVYTVAFVLPFVLLLASPWVAGLWLPALVGVALNLLLRGVLALRFGHHPVSVLLHPVAVVILVAIALNSWRWAWTGRTRWAGRTYPAGKVQP
jgi:chlorobactene glucosyltransferase